MWLSVTTPHWCGYTLFFVITDSKSWNYDPNKNFHRKMCSEQITYLPFLFDQLREKKQQEVVRKTWLWHRCWFLSIFRVAVIPRWTKLREE